jgi:hypothetical protein
MMATGCFGPMSSSPEGPGEDGRYAQYLGNRPLCASAEWITARTDAQCAALRGIARIAYGTP